MADPIEAAREQELNIAHLTKVWIGVRKFGERYPDKALKQAPLSRQPTLFERYRSEARGESFGEWLAKQAKP